MREEITEHYNKLAKQYAKLYPLSLNQKEKRETIQKQNNFLLTFNETS